MRDDFDAILRQKRESQKRHYKRLFETRENGTYEVDRRCLRSRLIKKENLPRLSVKNLPDFD
ncbi:hypothetical protein VB10N_00450 [Vibrio sp. 10N]|nr:hypothetical protein VB10N_00450 [Vibrio sp. 10N]